MELSMAIQILVVVLSGFAWTLGVIKYLVDRIDRGDENERKNREKALTVFADRRDFENHVEQNDRQISELRNDIRHQQITLIKAINDLGVQVSGRLDNLMLSLNRRADER